MKDLALALTKAKSIGDLNEIFSNGVSVNLSWMYDHVEVTGYEGAVSTDFIARKVISLFSSDEVTEETKRLASYLADKVFIPLKKLVESPENQCSLYQIVALNRITWTPPPDDRFGCSTALKHAMCLGHLDINYRTW